VVIAIPGFAAAQRVGVDSVWRDDLPVVRGLGLAALGGSATLTTVAMQAASLVPLGPLPYRMALVSAMALSVCAGMVFLLARRVLATHVPNSYLNVPLAGVAALGATLGPGLQSEATVAGGATVPLAAGLLVLWAATNADWPQMRRHLLTAVLLGVLWSDSMLAACAVSIAVVLGMLGRKDWPKDGKGWIPVPVMVGVAAAMMLPALLRPSSPHALLNFGHGLSQLDLSIVDPLAKPTTGLSAWRTEVGVVTLSLAAFGAVIGLLRARTRWLVLPLLIVVVADAVFPASQGGVLTVDLLTPMRSYAVAALVICSCLGVQTVVTTLSDTGLPMAKAAGVLVLLLALALVAVTAERSAFSVDRSATRGATVYTDAALVRLDPNAMILARSQPVVWRLLAAQIVGGARPDVVVVPLPLIARGTVAAGVLAVEPGASMLLRDMALEGTAGEHAISRVSDRRRLYVELDPSWNGAVATHLRADGIWLSLGAHPLGRSDRRIAASEAATTLERLAKTVARNQVSDPATQSILLAAARQQVVAAVLAKDRQATNDLLQRMAEVAPDDLFVRALKQRAEFATGSIIDVAGLIR